MKRRGGDWWRKRKISHRSLVMISTCILFLNWGGRSNKLVEDEYMGWTKQLGNQNISLYIRKRNLYVVNSHCGNWSQSLSCLGFSQFSSVTQFCPTLCDPMNRSMPGLPVHHHLPEFIRTHVYWVSDAIQPSHPLSSPFPPASNPSQHQSLSNESTLHVRWSKYWSFSYSIIPSKEIPGLISFRMDWLDLLAVQWTLKSPPTPQFKSINSLVLSLLHSSTLTSIHDHRKNHSLD